MSEKDIYLTDDERRFLTGIVRVGVHNAHEIMRARVLLLLDRTNKTNHVRYTEIAKRYGISRQAIYNMRNDYLETRDVETYVKRKQRETPPRAPKIDGEVEAKVIALACSKPPQGYSRWTVRLLAEKAIELHFVDELSHVTIYRLLKKRNISLT